MVTRESKSRAVRQQLDDLRKRLGVRNGDELDHTLIAVEALAMSMQAMSSDAATLIAEGERSVGMIVSAAMTGRALWRMYALPAAVASFVTLLSCGSFLALHINAEDARRDKDRAAAAMEWDKQRAERSADRLALERDRANLAAERATMEATLPVMLAHRADDVVGAAQGLVQQEVGNPGLIRWLSINGHWLGSVLRANKNNLCPQPSFDGPFAVCTYVKP